MSHILHATVTTQVKELSFSHPSVMEYRLNGKVISSQIYPSPCREKHSKKEKGTKVPKTKHIETRGRKPGRVKEHLLNA